MTAAKLILISIGVTLLAEGADFAELKGPQTEKRLAASTFKLIVFDGLTLPEILVKIRSNLRDTPAKDISIELEKNPEN